MKKIVCLLLAVAMLCSIFVGCTKKQVEEEPAAEQGTATKEATEEGTEEAAEEPVELVIFHHMSEVTKQNGVQAFANGTTAKYPYVDFDIQMIDNGEFNNLLSTKFAAGDAPDIIHGKVYEYPDYVEAGHLYNMTGKSYIEALGDNYKGGASLNGEYYGLPFDVMLLGFFYNKEIFAEHDLSAPKTWSDFENVITTLEDAGVQPFISSHATSWTTQLEVKGMFQGYGAKNAEAALVYDKVENENMNMADVPGIFEASERIIELYGHYSEPVDYGTSFDQFASGQGAMWYMGSWATGDIRARNDETEFGFFTMPVFDSEEEFVTEVTVDDSFMAAATSKHLQEVDYFFEYIASPDGIADWADATKLMSTMKNAASLNLDVESIGADILELIGGNYPTFNKADVPNFSSSFTTVFSNYTAMLSADPDQGAEAWLAGMDEEFDAIRD